MRDVIVVRVSELPSNGRMFWRGFLGGVLLFFAFILLLLIAGLSLLKGSGRVIYLYLSVAAPVAGLVMPLVLLVRYQSTIALPLRAHVAALGYATGLISIPIVCGIPFLLGREGLEECALAVMYSTISVYVYGVLAWAAGAIFFRKFSGVILQDGTLCPGCAYSLIGNTSMICPECGRAFTLDELGATREALAGGRAPEPA